MDAVGSPHPDRLPEQRRLRILAALDTGGGVRAPRLARQFNVSVETIRRDLLALEEQGLLRRVHGGAVQPVSRAFEPPYEQRIVANLARKQAMARLAATLVEPGDTLVLDVGTSIAEVAKALPSSFHGRVLTNSLLVTRELADHQGLELIASGGRVRPGDLSCSGPTAIEFFNGFHADRAFLGSGGVHPSAGLTDYHLDEIAVRKVFMDRCRERYVLADSTKIGQIAVGQVCPLDALTAVITDSDADPDVIAALEEAGSRVLVATIGPVSSPQIARAQPLRNNSRRTR